MKNEKNLKLSEIKIESFVTSLTDLNNEEQKMVQGVMDARLGTTYMRIFC